MPKNLTYVPPGGSLVEVGLRCLNARYLLRPSDTLNDYLIGALGRAQRRSGIRVVGVSALSNHAHLLLWADDGEQLADFMEYAAGNAAREIGRLHNQRGKFWHSRYAKALLTEEEPAQVERFRYLLEQGCKEDLVASPRQWPGLNPAKAILSGRPHKGIWVDRTGLYNARRRKSNKLGRMHFVHEETLELSPLPCWSHLSKEEYRRRVEEMVDAIEEETRERHRRDGTEPLGARAVLEMDPHYRPKEAKESPMPLVMGATKAAKARIRRAYRDFVRRFRAAAIRLQEERPRQGFPAGAFPAPAPFVRTDGPFDPG